MRSRTKIHFTIASPILRRRKAASKGKTLKKKNVFNKKA